MLQRSWWKKCHTEYKVLCSNCWNINTFSYAFVKCHKCGIPSCPKHSWQSRMRSLWKCNNPDSFFLSSGEGDTIAVHQDKNAVEKITGWIILFFFSPVFLFSHTVKQAWSRPDSLVHAEVFEDRCSKCTWVLSPEGTFRQRVSVVVTT